MNNPHLSKKEQRQIEKTIKAGRDARRKLKNYSEEIRTKRDKNLALLKKLKQRIKMTEKIDLIYISEEGRIGFQVNNVYYEYRLDASYFPAVLKMNQRRPDKALEFVRKISPGLAKLGNMMREKEAKKWYESREGILKRWDYWRKYIASGGKSSWPRDEFESLLDCYFK